VRDGFDIAGKSERSPLLARRGGCGEAADGVVAQVQKKKSIDRDPPPRPLDIWTLRNIFLSSRPPLLARRGDRSDLLFLLKTLHTFIYAILVSRNRENRAIGSPMTK